jgi:hypothetical protein
MPSVGVPPTRPATGFSRHDRCASCHARHTLASRGWGRRAGRARCNKSPFGDEIERAHQGAFPRLEIVALPFALRRVLQLAEKRDHYLGRIDDLRKVDAVIRFVSFEPLLASVARADLTGIQWAIVGGESGPRARPMVEQWVAEIEAACRKAKTAFFFKQWGGVRKKSTGRHYRGRTFDEMPRAAAMS